MNDIKLKLRPGHAGGRDWMAPGPLWQLFWNVNSKCNFRCQVCFSDSGDSEADELTTDEAKRMIRNARDSGVNDIVISGGEPFLREDLFELLVYMKELGISSRIATNGSLLDADLCLRLRRETSAKAFQISLDTLDREVYEEVHGAPATMLDHALEVGRCLQEQGFHTTVSTRLMPKNLPGIPALLDRAASEKWATVTVHCPLHTGRALGAWPPGTDLLTLLEPVFEHFLKLPAHWVVETNIPWARYHPTIRALSKRAEVVHDGCGGGRCRLAIGASGWITPCICSDLPQFRMGNVRVDDLATVFRDAPMARLMRRPQDYGVCADCVNVTVCGAGCRASALARSGLVDGLDESCPVRQGRNKVRAVRQ